MAANVLEIPFRRTHSVDLSSAIKQYISSKYDQSPGMFTDDLREIDRLRSDAISVQEPHTSGIRKLAVYAAQLRYLGGKFPIDIGVDFPWYPAIGYDKDKPVLQNNLRFELANILFNLAALYSQLSVRTNWTTIDGLKQAAEYGIAAAGVLAFIRKEILPDMRSTPPEDMDDVTLDSLQNLCLAQAQECFWQITVKKNMSDGTVAKLAAKVSDYYILAADAGRQSRSVSSEWIHHMQAKHHHFAAAAQYRQSRYCLQNKQYGEEIARLKDSIACVNEGLQEARWISATVVGDLNGLKTRVQEDLKRAEKDNDVIYLHAVTPKSELRILDRTNMVAPKTPADVADGISLLGEGQPFGKALFDKLVPYAVHQAASIYEDRRDRLLNQSIIADLEAMTARLREVLQSLDLPGSLQALEKPLGLPGSLVSKAEELRQQDALYRIKRSMEDTTKLKTNDLTIYQEGMSLLDAEKVEDDRARARYGTERWSRQPSEIALGKLYQSSKDLQTYLNSAASSDNLVEAKFRENEHILKILSGTNRDLERFVPSSRQVEMTPAIDQAASRLRTCLNEVSRLETRRKNRINALREKGKADDIGPALLAEAARLEREYPMQKIDPSQFEALFDRRLQTYESDRDILAAEQEEQDQIVARLREANKAFLDARRGDTSTRDRQKALQALDTGYAKYKELISNLETGRKFYNDLAGHVTRFRENVKAQVNERRVEASQLEGELSGQDMGRLNLEETRRELTSQSQTQSQSHSQGQGQGQGPQTRSIKNQTAPTPQQRQDGITAPVPTRSLLGHPPPPAAGVMPSTSPVPVNVAGGTIAGGGVWRPDMGIRFGGAPANQPGQAGYPVPRRP
ncbi:pH-response regulator protein palA/rim20 [Exophiala xenobiotica]|uniref:PH-response regulator protein palA/rim20 n=1 Tax=Vermiconidia calcicola TaxID=1690605 RepID=A0AAV9Q6D4_9PEZI|nr:pH-response regulator protein palA/rim20 [Exophiala xenobiotica]KAK5534785.1 pH-response regulator protein palA/rim20 [Chaetothyriales sp. CCFEE 6169]KAK5535190.1 pH-response regulator protein palA/rim20 [Vermiconidia calcicola]KAK5197470.1 pH-response regulator protein palA/rim20 [Exophiala xenobiotica]KAK5209399.1 pH-response regulator protein palA/rim20 [Exophiala xenobiotica]